LQPFSLFVAKRGSCRNSLTAFSEEYLERADFRLTFASSKGQNNSINNKIKKGKKLWQRHQ
jgi:hypothetical protein